MKKKLIMAVVAILVVVCAVFVINKQTKPETVVGSKAIEVVIMDKDNGVELYKGTLHTDAELLSELLNEQTEFQVTMEDSEWGAYITSMCDQKESNPDGPWWTYESENNESCVSEGYCNAASLLPIADGDKFVFNLTSNF